MAEIAPPSEEVKGLLFTLKDISYSPVSPRMNEAFTVKGKIELFKIPFIGPIWVIATVVYPETFWEELIPIWGSPEVRESDTALGGNFELTFKKGFEREGEFSLAVRAYAGPTKPLDSLTLPPFPPVTSQETTFIVGGEVPEEELGFRNFKVLSYSKNGGTPVTPPSVLDLNVGDKLRINVGFEHMGGAVSAGLYGAIGNLHKTPVTWFDEVLKGETPFNVPSSPDWKPYSTGYYVEIPITSAIASGTYSIYAKIIRITGGDIISPYVENVVTIAGGAPPEAVWEMVEEVSNIVVEAAPAVTVWLMVEEVSGIVVETSAPVAGWQMVEEVSSIVVEAAAAPPPPPTEPTITDLTIVGPYQSTWIGGNIYITVMFKYIGPAITGRLYAAIGNAGWAGFDEVWAGQVVLSIAAATSKQTRLASVMIPIVGHSPGTYDIYCKIDGVPGPDIYSPVYSDTITITS